MKRFLMILMCLVLAMTALGAVGCGEKKIERSNPLIVLNDFENTMDYDTIHLRGYLGRVTKNTDSQYVTRGSASAKVEVEAKAYATHTHPQSIYQECNLKAKGLNYSDFAYTSDITLDVFNTQAEDKEFKLQLVYEITGHADLIAEVPESYTLKAGSWNSVRYTVDRAYIPTTTVDDENGNEKVISYVKALVFIFENPPDAQEEPFDVYYVDNVCLYQTTVPFISESRSLTHHDNVYEICSFDSLWQVKNLGLEYNTCINVSWCKDFTSDGYGASLRVNTTPSTDGYSSWPSVRIPYDLFTGSSIGNSIDLVDIDENDEFVFDYYIPGEGMDNVSVTLNAMYDRLYSATAMGERGKWNTFRVTIAEINDHLEADLSESTVFRRLKNVQFGIGRGLPGSVRSFYIDNVRIVVNPN